MTADSLPKARASSLGPQDIFLLDRKNPGVRVTIIDAPDERR